MGNRIIFVKFLLLVGLFQLLFHSVLGCSRHLRNESRAIDVYVIASNINDYHREFVCAEGLIYIGFETNLLEPKRKAKLTKMIETIWLDLSQEEMQKYRDFDGKEGVVCGVVNKLNKGHMSLNAGSIEEIESIQSK